MSQQQPTRSIPPPPFPSSTFPDLATTPQDAQLVNTINYGSLNGLEFQYGEEEVDLKIDVVFQRDLGRLSILKPYKDIQLTTLRPKTHHWQPTRLNKSPQDEADSMVNYLDKIDSDRSIPRELVRGFLSEGIKTDRQRIMKRECRGDSIEVIYNNGEKYLVSVGGMAGDELRLSPLIRTPRSKQPYALLPIQSVFMRTIAPIYQVASSPFSIDSGAGNLLALRLPYTLTLLTSTPNPHYTPRTHTTIANQYTQSKFTNTSVSLKDSCDLPITHLPLDSLHLKSRLLETAWNPYMTECLSITETNQLLSWTPSSSPQYCTIRTNDHNADLSTQNVFDHESFRKLVWTPHPRVVNLATSNDIQTIDLRNPDSLSTLYTPLAGSYITSLTRSESNSYEIAFSTTNNTISVLDTRFPTKHLLSWQTEPDTYGQVIQSLSSVETGDCTVLVAASHTYPSVCVVEYSRVNNLHTTSTISPGYVPVFTESGLYPGKVSREVMIMKLKPISTPALSGVKAWWDDGVMVAQGYDDGRVVVAGVSGKDVDENEEVDIGVNESIWNSYITAVAKRVDAKREPKCEKWNLERLAKWSIADYYLPTSPKISHHYYKRIQLQIPTHVTNPTTYLDHIQHILIHSIGTVRTPDFEIIRLCYPPDEVFGKVRRLIEVVRDKVDTDDEEECGKRNHVNLLVPDNSFTKPVFCPSLLGIPETVSILDHNALKAFIEKNWYPSSRKLPEAGEVNDIEVRWKKAYEKGLEVFVKEIMAASVLFGVRADEEIKSKEVAVKPEVRSEEEEDVDMFLFEKDKEGIVKPEVIESTTTPEQPDNNTLYHSYITPNDFLITPLSPHKRLPLSRSAIELLDRFRNREKYYPPLPTRPNDRKRGYRTQEEMVLSQASEEEYLRIMTQGHSERGVVTQTGMGMGMGMVPPLNPFSTSAGQVQGQFLQHSASARPVIGGLFSGSQMMASQVSQVSQALQSQVVSQAMSQPETQGQSQGQSQGQTQGQSQAKKRKIRKKGF